MAPARAGDDLPRVRLARSLLELMALAVRLTPAAAGVAGCELVVRLTRMLGRVDGKLVLLPDYVGKWLGGREGGGWVIAPCPVRN